MKRPECDRAVTKGEKRDCNRSTNKICNISEIECLLALCNYGVKIEECSDITKLKGKS